MRFLLIVLLLFGVAGGAGLSATWFVANGGAVFDTLAIGPWTARPLIGTPGIDPYARAEMARRGELPLGSGEGILFLAEHDDEGRPLDGRCDVTVAGPTPPARFWTLTLYRPDGGLAANEVGRYGFTSLEVLRRADGAFAIVVAPRARPGNWLPTGGIEHYFLGLRFFDTPVGLRSRGVRDDHLTALPAIRRGPCP